MNDEAWETRGGALRVIPAETRLTVYRRRPVALAQSFCSIGAEHHWNSGSFPATRLRAYLELLKKKKW